MEEEKAAAYYDELTLKGGGAARFKQGLGFSSSSGDLPAKGSALPSSSSFLSTFVKASTSTNSSQIDSQSQLSNIQNKLKKKVPISPIHQKTPSLHDDSDIIRVRDRSRERDRGRGEERQLRSRSRERRRERHRSSSRERRRGLRRRSRSRERSRRSSSRERRRDRERDLRRRSRSRERCRRSSSRESRDKDKDRRRKRSLSPRGRKSEKGRGEGGGKKEGGNGGVDYSKLIEGYDHMTPAERVKAKMKVQLSQTAEKDEKMGTGSQWERFEFDKDAPVDDEELPAADDDATVVKRIGHSFRFASLEGKIEDELRNAHDEAMFGVPARQVSHTFESEEENKKENEGATDDDNDLSSVLLNEKVLSKQQGSWRDRTRRNAG